MGNQTEFRHGALMVLEALPTLFDLDLNVSVFETNIRVLGGLLRSGPVCLCVCV